MEKRGLVGGYDGNFSDVVNAIDMAEQNVVLGEGELVKVGVPSGTTSARVVDNARGDSFNARDEYSIAVARRVLSAIGE